MIEYEYRERLVEQVDFDHLKETDPKMPDESLRVSAIQEVLDSSFMFSKKQNNDSHIEYQAESRQTYMQGHRLEINYLKDKENNRMTAMVEEDYLELSKQMRDTACLAMSIHDIL